MRCATCGKEVFDNGEERFACPHCGAEVVAVEESTEERCRRLERECYRVRLDYHSSNGLVGCAALPLAHQTN